MTAGVGRSVRATVDLQRLAQNYNAVAAYARRPLLPVIKADAYGHGALRVARHLAALGAERFAVAYVDEALRLRQGGLECPLVVLAPFEPDQAAVLVEQRLTPVISTPETLEAVLRLAPPAHAPLDVHLKVDTGMGRLGFAPDETEAAAQALAGAAPRLRFEGLLTQLASADEDPEATRAQLDRFDAVVAALAARGLRARFVHAANSAGLAYLRPSHTLARPGLLLYGVAPRPLAPPIAVRPVMRVSGPLVQLRTLPAGATVSYGGRWVAPRAVRLAVVALGYADGVPRTTGMRSGGVFLVRGRRVPVVGTVCMDLTMLDVSDLPEVAVGDEALLLGDDPEAWELATHAGTNAWQVLTGIGARVPRVYVDGPEAAPAEPLVARGEAHR